MPSSIPEGPHQNIAWGARVSPEFKSRIIWAANDLGCPVDDLMACMAWESAETFRPDIKNAAGSGAVGLIQFMPGTAVQLGTTTDHLKHMTAEDQINYVYKYFKPYKGRLHNLGDIYMAILYPKGIGKDDSYTLFSRSSTPIAYRENEGLDTEKKGYVTRGDCLQKIKEKLSKGLASPNFG